MKLLRVSPLALLLPLALSTACRPSSSAREQRLASASGTANRIEVARMLGDQHLITIPEVKAKADYYTIQYRTGKMTPEASAKALRLWLDAYVAAHPDTVAAVQALHDRHDGHTPANYDAPQPDVRLPPGSILLSHPPELPPKLRALAEPPKTPHPPVQPPSKKT